MKRLNPRKDLENLIGRILSTKEDVTKDLTGLLGTYDSEGYEVVDVENRENFVYVRIAGNISEVIEAYNNTVYPEFDTKVLLRKSKYGNFYEITGLDIPQYSTWGGNAFVPTHALTHSFGEGDNEGADPIFIYKRQLLQPLGVHPNSTGSMRAVVEADFYIWNNTIKYFPGGETADFTSLIPTGTYSRFITVYLDGNSETLKYVTGTDFYVSYFTTGTMDYIPEVSLSAGIPLAAVYMTTGMTSVDWENLFDIRNFLNAGGSENTQVHALDPLYGYHSGTIRSSVSTVVDSGEYYTNTNVEDVLQEIAPHLTGGYLIVEKNGSVVGRRKRVNFIEGTNVTLTMVDDSVDDEVDITITSSGGGGTGSSGHIIYDATGSYPNRGGLQFQSQGNVRVYLSDDSLGDKTVVYISGSSVDVPYQQTVLTGSAPSLGTSTGVVFSGVTGTILQYNPPSTGIYEVTVHFDHYMVTNSSTTLGQVLFRITDGTNVSFSREVIFEESATANAQRMPITIKWLFNWTDTNTKNLQIQRRNATQTGISTNQISSVWYIIKKVSSELVQSYPFNYNASYYSGTSINLGTTTDSNYTDADNTNSTISITPTAPGQYRVTYFFNHYTNATAVSVLFRLMDNEGQFSKSAQVYNRSDEVHPVVISHIFNWTNTSEKTIRLQKWVNVATAVTTNQIIIGQNREFYKTVERLGGVNNDRHIIMTTGSVYADRTKLQIQPQSDNIKINIVDDSANDKTIVYISGTKSGLISYGEFRNSTGSWTLNSASWTNLDTNTDLILNANVGDVLEVNVNGLLGNQAVTGFLNAAIIVTGGVVRTLGAVESSTSGGVEGWARENTTAIYTPVSGLISTTLTSSDISGGQVRIRLRYRTGTASNLVLWGTSTNIFFWSCKIFRL